MMHSACAASIIMALAAAPGHATTFQEGLVSPPKHASSAPATIRLAPRALPVVRDVDERFQSFQVGFSHVTGGRTWRSYDTLPSGRDASQADIADRQSDLYQERRPIDFTNRRLRTLTAALGPAYIRYSGTTANSFYFLDDERQAQGNRPAGFQEVLTRQAWRGAVDFAHAVDARIVTSFAVSTGVRDRDGVWTPAQAQRWLAFTRSIGGRIHAAEMFNEPNLSTFGSGPQNYGGEAFARDFERFRTTVDRSGDGLLVAGPGDVLMGGPIPGHPTAEQFLSASPRPRFDIISYHFYPAVSQRCAPANSPIGSSPDAALTEAWLARPDRSFQERRALRDRFPPGAPIWLTETGGAACGGSPWHATFLDSFRLMDQQARLAKQGLDAMFTHALVGENYGLMDEETFTPRPNYWASLAWRRFMGRRVLDAGQNQPGVHVYAHCQRDRSGGVAILAINLNTQPTSIHVNGPAELYALTSTEQQGRTVMMNGRALALGRGDRLPRFIPRLVRGEVPLAPTSINFITVPAAGNAGCRAGS